jgi:hypothetical protein
MSSIHLTVYAYLANSDLFEVSAGLGSLQETIFECAPAPPFPPRLAPAKRKGYVW